MKKNLCFRAWDKQAKRFFKRETRLCAMTISITLSGEIIGHPNIGEMTELYELNQFVGLIDYNGKEVYQGDILKVTPDKEGYGSLSYEGHVVIVPQTCGYSLKMFNPSTEEMDEQGISYDSTSLWHIDGDDGKWIEVIGNIYENPELLPK